MDRNRARLLRGGRASQRVLKRRRVERIVDGRPLEIDRPAHHGGKTTVLSVAQAVLAGTEAAADRGLAIAEDIPSKTEARRALDTGTGEGVRKFLAEHGTVVDIARSGDHRPNPGTGPLLA